MLSTRFVAGERNSPDEEDQFKERLLLLQGIYLHNDNGNEIVKNEDQQREECFRENENEGQGSHSLEESKIQIEVNPTAATPTTGCERQCCVSDDSGSSSMSQGYNSEKSNRLDEHLTKSPTCVSDIVTNDEADFDSHVERSSEAETCSDDSSLTVVPSSGVTNEAIGNDSESDTDSDCTQYCFPYENHSITDLDECENAVPFESVVGSMRSLHHEDTNTVDCGYLADNESKSKRLVRTQGCFGGASTIQKQRKSQRFHASKSKVDDIAEQTYPLDGLWKVAFSCGAEDNGMLEIHCHTFQMFGHDCELKIGDSTDGYRPQFQWPVQVTCNNNPIYQKSNTSIPPQMELEDAPLQIDWFTNDPCLGTITWKKESSFAPEKELRNDTILCRVGSARRSSKTQQSAPCSVGKAWRLVEAAMGLETNDIKLIAKDDIVFLTERLLDAREDFRRRNVPIRIDLAYHHTKGENLNTIRKEGLLSHSERKERSIDALYNGSAYGDGIYCSISPLFHAEDRYGDTTILLARMKGLDTMHIRGIGERTDNICREFDALVIPQKGSCVLKNCSQCIPLFHFPMKRLKEGSGFLSRLQVFHERVQKLLDTIFEQESLHQPRLWF